MKQSGLWLFETKEYYNELTYIIHYLIYCVKCSWTLLFLSSNHPDFAFYFYYMWIYS